MNGEEDWDEPRLFLAEQTGEIRRRLATAMIPVLLIAAACGALSLTARERPQLAAVQGLHAPAALIDRH